MDKDQFDHLITNYKVYGFYTFGGNEIVCSKLNTLDKYFISGEGCSCKGFRSHGICKHVRMLNGAWTTADGTPEWFDSHFGEMWKVELPETFSTVVVTDDLPFGYEILTITVNYGKFHMGIMVYDKNFKKDEYKRIIGDA